MKKEKNYKEILAEKGLKCTNQRIIILEVLNESEALITAEEIYLKLKDKDKEINLSTVYRTLEILVSKNIILKLNSINDERAKYIINNSKHKHLLICVDCDKIVSISECPLKELERNLVTENEFEIIGHKLEFYGHCPECKRKIQK